MGMNVIWLPICSRHSSDREELGGCRHSLDQKTAAGVEVICSVDEPEVETPPVREAPVAPKKRLLQGSTVKPHVVATEHNDLLLAQKRENDQAATGHA